MSEEQSVAAHAAATGATYGPSPKAIPADMENIASATPGKVVFTPPPRRPTWFPFNPDTLVNLDGPGLRERIGEPIAIREEPPAVIWSYVTGDCRLDIYLYESLKLKTLRSLTYVLESSRQDVDPKTYCLRNVE